MTHARISEPVGFDCGCTPRSIHLRTNSVVCIVVVVVLVVLQNLGVDPFAALGILGAAGWVTTGLMPNLVGTASSRAVLG
jgi:hypothetical protein